MTNYCHLIIYHGNVAKRGRQRDFIPKPVGHRFEQYILESAYLDEVAYLDICAHLGIEKDAYYKRKSRALAHLTTLLYGII